MGEPEHIMSIMERVICNLAELQEEADGWRGRNLIVDSQIESLGKLVAEQKASLQILREIIAGLPDAGQVETRINRLTEAILRQERRNQGASDDGSGPGLEKMFR